MLLIPVEQRMKKKDAFFLSLRKRLCKYLKGDAKRETRRTSKSYMRQINLSDAIRVLHIPQSKVQIYIKAIREIKKLFHTDLSAVVFISLSVILHLHKVLGPLNSCKC